MQKKIERKRETIMLEVFVAF